MPSQFTKFWIAKTNVNLRTKPENGIAGEFNAIIGRQIANIKIVRTVKVAASIPKYSTTCE